MIVLCPKYIITLLRKCYMKLVVIKELSYYDVNVNVMFIMNISQVSLDTQK